MVTTCSKNEQQQHAKNSAEVETTWTKTTWKTVEQTIGRGRNGSVKAQLVTDDEDDIYGSFSSIRS